MVLQRIPVVMLVLAAIGFLAFTFKLAVLPVGAPYVTVDDNTMYEGGFLVWFGQAPPQRMYLESWISGIVSIVTYIARLAASGQLGTLNGNIVADAWSSFQAEPDTYVLAYRWFALCIDLATVVVVYAIALEAFRSIAKRRYPALLVAVLYLLSFNTIWSNVVARPDTLTAFFASLGLLLYLRSGAGEQRRMLIYSAIAFGLAAGMKLHAAFFAVCVALDLLRQRGMRAGILPAAGFGATSFLLFCVASGTLMFDPILYVKLRYLNSIDDASPWIQWGEQFLVVLYGSGWLVVPLFAYGVVQATRAGLWRKNPAIASVLFFAGCWLLLFCAIRQLRSYWMLPALPVLYVSAVWAIWTISRQWVRWCVCAALVGIMLIQCLGQVQSLRSTRYNELRAWVTSHISPQEPVYVLGFAGLGIPRNEVATSMQRQGLERKISSASRGGDGFIHRHAQLWEERAQSQLIDMLNHRWETGHTWFGYYETPLADFDGILSWDSFRYVIVQQGFSLERSPSIQESLRSDFVLAATLTGPGGHSNGLEYQVYERR